VAYYIHIMKLQFPLGAVLALAASGCGNLEVVSKLSTGGGDEPGAVVSQSFDVPEFTKIEAGSSLQIEYSTGRKRSVTVQADTDVMSHISVSVSDGVLHLKTEGSFSTHEPIIVKIENPALTGFFLSGASKGDFKGISSEAFEVLLSGSSDAKLVGHLRSLRVEVTGSSKLDAASRGKFDLSGFVTGSSEIKTVGVVGELDIQATGASRIKLDRLDANSAKASVLGSSSMTAHGSAKTLTSSVTGASELRFDGVKVDTAEVTATGSSHVTIGETKNLKAVATGASEITYRGHPEVSRVTTGGSSIEPG
jgi:hypothetical protein